MAKFNQVRLYGIVLKPVRVTETKDRATALLKVVRNSRETGDTDKQLRQDCPIVMSSDPEIVEKMSEFEPNDMVYVKGVIVTKSVEKATTCPCCNNDNAASGTIVYVEPIYVERREHGLSQKEAIDLLYEKKEISNEVTVIGNLCIDPQKVTALKKTTISQYQIAIPRTYRVKGSQDDEKTDFPWVKSYGSKAKEDLKRLHVGSTVLIDGYIQARTAPRHTECAHCKTEYDWSDPAMEIVPYETEYLKNYVTDEELELINSKI